MNYDLSDIAAMYDRGVETEHMRLERHQLEFDLTWRYFTRYLPATGSILEIGAGQADTHSSYANWAMV